MDGELAGLVTGLHALLSEHHRPFGYRVVNEIGRYVTLAARQAGSEPVALHTALDLALVQKVLPKFHGTQQELEDPLERLLAFVISGDRDEEPPPVSAVEADWTLQRGRLVSTASEPTAEPKLPHTAAKVWRMLRRLRQQGFTSFME